MALLTVFALSRLTASLPADLASLNAWGSPQDSRILDAVGVERARFRLVDPSRWPEGTHEELVEAFLAASPPAFYEPRSLSATSLAPALRRLLAGTAPPASPLSAELARLLLSDEPPGPARRLREDLVSTWLDAEAPLPRRVVAWIDRVPLCLGRRGLERAATVCLGTPLADLDVGARVTLAAAAAWRLDLAGDRDILQARRGQVLDELVVRGRLKGLEAARFAARGTAVPRPSGPSAWAELIALAPRHRLGRFNETRSATVETTLRWEVQTALRASLPEGAGFVAVQTDSGDVVAMGGDVLRPVGGPEGPTVLDLAAWGVGMVRSASASGGLPRSTEGAALRWTRRVLLDGRAGSEVEGSSEGDTLGTPGRHPLLASPPADLLGVASLSELPVDAGLRRATVSEAQVLLHEQLVVVWFGSEGPVVPAVQRLVGGVAFSRPERYSWTP